VGGDLHPVTAARSHTCNTWAVSGVNEGQEIVRRVDSA
jgi:hypothetical protein